MAYAGLIISRSMKFRVDWKVIYSVIYIESYFRTNAKSVSTQMEGDSAR